MSYSREYNIVENKEISKVLKSGNTSQEDRAYFITSYSLLFIPVEQGDNSDNFDFWVKVKNLSYRGGTQIKGIENSDLIDDYTNPFESIIANSLFKIKIDKNGRVIDLVGYDELLKKIKAEFGNSNKYPNIEKQLVPFEKFYFINLIETLLNHLPICLDKEFIDLRFLSSCPMETGHIKRINTSYKIKEQDEPFAVIETSESFNDEIEIEPNLVLPLNVIHEGVLTFDYLSNRLVKSLSHTASQGEVKLNTSKILINVKSELLIEEIESREDKIIDSVYSKKGFGFSKEEFKLSGSEHSLNLTYEFFSEPDELIVYDQFGKEFYNSGMQSTKQPISVSIPLAGIEKLVFRINTKSSKSQWRYEFSFK